MTIAETQEAEKPSLALIGSFRKHYNEVLSAANIFEDHGWHIKSPKCTPVSFEGKFVRFESDNEALTDAEIQSVTLRNIFGADLVYVVNPGGYIGRTTCYEIGRIIQRRQPIYFLEHPNDLPVEIPVWAVSSPRELVSSSQSYLKPRWLYDGTNSFLAEIERAL